MAGEKETLTFEELKPGMKFENAACKWTILGIPRYHFRHPQHGNVMKVRAKAELKDATKYTNEVDLTGYEHDEIEVSL
jgi:hypothetical protein